MTDPLTIPQACKRLGVSHDTLLRMRRRGELPLGTIPGYRSVRLDRKAVEELARWRSEVRIPRPRRASRFVLEDEAAREAVGGQARGAAKATERVE